MNAISLADLIAFAFRTKVIATSDREGTFTAVLNSGKFSYRMENYILFIQQEEYDDG